VFVLPAGRAGAGRAGPAGADDLDSQGRSGAGGPDLALQIEPAAAPIDGALQGGGRGDLEGEGGLGENQVISLLLAVAHKGRVVEEAPVRPFAGEGGAVCIRGQGRGRRGRRWRQNGN